MKRTAWALAILALVCVGALPVQAATGAVTPVLQAQDQGGVGEDLTKAQRYYLRGVELMNNLKHLDAVEAFQLAIDEDAKYVDAYRRLALAYTEMAKSDAEYYRDALDTYMDLEALLPPDDVEVRVGKPGDHGGHRPEQPIEPLLLHETSDAENVRSIGQR